MQGCTWFRLQSDRSNREKQRLISSVIFQWLPLHWPESPNEARIYVSDGTFAMHNDSGDKCLHTEWETCVCSTQKQINLGRRMFGFCFTSAFTSIVSPKQLFILFVNSFAENHHTFFTNWNSYTWFGNEDVFLLFEKNMGQWWQPNKRSSSLCSVKWLESDSNSFQGREIMRPMEECK